MVSAAPMGSANERLTSISSSVRMGLIGWHSAEHLVQAATDFRPEAKGQRCARCIGEFTDSLEAESSKISDDLVGQPEQRERKLLDRSYGFASGNNDDFAGDRAGACVCRAPCVGDGHSRSQPLGAEPVGDTRQHWLLAALKMVGTFSVHNEAIMTIDGDDR
jgi:hypothetical protein